MCQVFCEAPIMPMSHPLGLIHSFFDIYFWTTLKWDIEHIVLEYLSTLHTCDLLVLWSAEQNIRLYKQGRAFHSALFSIRDKTYTIRNFNGTLRSVGLQWTESTVSELGIQRGESQIYWGQRHNGLMEKLALE